MHAETQIDALGASDLNTALRAQLDRILTEVVSTATDRARSAASDSARQVEDLISRLRALVPSGASHGQPSRETLLLGELSIDVDGHEVQASGRPLHLTRREFGVLRLLLKERDRALTREEILEHVWGNDGGVNSQRTVDIHIHRLRTKLGPSFSDRLQTLRNVGYKLRFEPLPVREA